MNLGKIGQLPTDIIDTLNQRLADHVPGKKIVDWLNSLPEVQAVLAQHFDSRPINEQNLSPPKIRLQP